MKAWRSLLVLAVLVFLPTKHSAGQSQGPPTMQPLVVTVTPWGPDQNAIDAARAMVVSHPSVRRYLDGTRNRLLSLQLLDSPIAGQPPNGIRIVFYDYTNNRAV